MPDITKVEPPIQHTVLTDISHPKGGAQKDYYTEQYYSATSPRGPKGGLEVRSYKLEKDHSHHRAKVYKNRFDRLQESLKSKLQSAENSWKKSSGFLNSENHSKELEVLEETDSWDPSDSVKQFAAEEAKDKDNRRGFSALQKQTGLNRSKICNRLGKSYITSSVSVKPEAKYNNFAENLNQDNIDYCRTGNMSESTLAEPRLHEKQEMQSLNARLSQYIRYIREMKENSGYLDSQVFLESVTVLEEELNHLKNMYEKELDNAR